MIALSIRQPWASLILKAGKDIENRSWPTNVRGRILIHAAKGCTRDELEDALEFAEEACGTRYSVDLKTIARGGIIGSVEIVDCVSKSDSPWFVGPYGFVLRDPRPLPFIPFNGRLGFFDVPESLMNGDSVKTCDYPHCNCPFDAPADQNWCARGLPKKAARAR